jgi:hypothetical protein
MTTRNRSLQTRSIPIFLFLLRGAQLRFRQRIQRFLPSMRTIRPIRRKRL